MDKLISRAEMPLFIRSCASLLLKFCSYILLVHFLPPYYIVSNSCAYIRGMEATSMLK